MGAEKKLPPCEEARGSLFDFAPLSAESASFVGNAVLQKNQHWIFLAIGLLFTVFFARLGSLQLVHGEYYRLLAEGNRLRTMPVMAKRGLITDTNGVILAENVPSFRLALIPGELPKEPLERKELFDRVTTLTGVSAEEIETALKEVAEDSTRVTALHVELTTEQAISILVRSEALRGVTVEMGARRRYPRSTEHPSYSHLLGYEGKITAKELKELSPAGYSLSDRVGKTGLETVYEKELRGNFGRMTMEVDAQGEALRVIASDGKTDGVSLRLGIDSGLQEVAERELGKAVAAWKGKGAVVAMDPRSGVIRALVSLPSYDNNDFSAGIRQEQYAALQSDPSLPMFHRAVSGEYPSGSTIKIIYAAGALAKHIVTPTTTVFSSGGLRLGQWFFPDWKAGGHGITNVKKAIAESVNTFFYMIGGGYESFHGMGIEGLEEIARGFGIGSKLGIDLPAEGKGNFPNPEWKKRVENLPWYIGDTYNTAIGQGGTLVTPLQVAAYTSAIANGGTLYAPTMVESFVSPTDRATPNPRRVIRSDILPKDAIDVVRAGMRDTVLVGVAKSLQSLPIAVAGKTGTAQFSSKKDPHAWFTCFAPYENPELVITVLVEEGKEGSRAATPVAREILRYWAERRLAAEKTKTAEQNADAGTEEDAAATEP